MNGKVKWFSEEKGYGFITTAQGKDIFVHYSEIVADGFKTLNEGDEVTYDEKVSDRGLTATNVTKVN